MKAILVVDISDDLFEDYENFYIDYDLRAEKKNENFTESIKYVEDCPLKPMPGRMKHDDASAYKQGFTNGFNSCLEILRTYEYKKELTK